ncbi:MAG: phenylacetate-CoA oxygenase subunit PaaI [Candidatus Sericytochromatia bacterium]|uniref:Phenylacetate-CoA oxygenase subunit PaaI n=1 Tax=Candidatus Tanganyikabacteria bacterium TaxID=2961651 RepID=A0A937X3P0_9BACT|nr:phenylacetate-CoA oxygenase subunit PaaI [Candidatus Tanganyikabacteria bacterium]
MVSHEQVLERLARGEKIERPEEMSPEYHEALVNLMTQQADSELAGGLGYVPWIAKAPSIEEKLAVASIVRDEIRHAKVMYGLLRDLGLDVEAHIAQHDYNFRLDDAGADIGTDRLAADGRVNIFYYPIDSWADFIMFNFCMDRGAGHQLEDVKESSFSPWAKAITGIFAEEMAHVGHGNFWVKKLGADPATREEAQGALEKWYVRTMNIFGRPGTKKNALYRDLGLKKRDNQDVRNAFTDEVHPLITEAGLTIPRWEAAWAAEEAVAIGG